MADMVALRADAAHLGAEPLVAKHLDAKTCTKIELPAPAKHQCHRAATQAPVSSRPRPQDNQDSASLAGTAVWLTLGTIDASPDVAERFELRGANRRSAFWQVFAYAVRLRR